MSETVLNPEQGIPIAYPLQDAAVRRTDVRLRARFPQLNTRIFEVSSHNYRIVFDRTVVDADKIRDEFSQSIRPIVVNADVSNDLPASFLRELAPILDNELSHGFAGFSFSRDDFRTALAGSLPSLPELISLGDSRSPTFTLCFERALNPDEEAAVRRFFDQWEPGWPIEFAILEPLYGPPNPTPDITGDILRIRSARARPRAPHFVQEDEAFWFDNVNQIFEGGMSRATIIGGDDSSSSCYLDGGGFAQIDLRQALICYDTIYLSPPLVDGRQSFWQSQVLKRDDILELVEAGRLRFVLRQPEERTDPSFLSEIYKTSPTAIIGRRRASAVLASDIVQTADEYRLTQPGIVEHVPELVRELSKRIGAPESELMQLLFWPSAARRGCIEPLMAQGLMSLGAFGPGNLLGTQLQRVSGKDLVLEALVTSEGVFIAHALDATFVPSPEDMAGWIHLQRAIGARLNFYRSFNSRIAAQWAANEERREAGLQLIPPVPIFEFDRHAKVSDLIRLTSYSSTRRKGRALLTRLSELPTEERAAEIERLTAELFEVGGRKEQRAMYLDTADNVKEVGAAIADIGLLPVRSMWGLVKIITQLARHNTAIDQILDRLQRDLTPQSFRNEDLSFLSKIERVAELRK